MNNLVDLGWILRVEGRGEEKFCEDGVGLVGLGIEGCFWSVKYRFERDLFWRSESLSCIESSGVWVEDCGACLFRSFINFNGVYLCFLFWEDRVILFIVGFVRRVSNSDIFI